MRLKSNINCDTVTVSLIDYHVMDGDRMSVTKIMRAIIYYFNVHNHKHQVEVRKNLPKVVIGYNASYIRTV